MESYSNLKKPFLALFLLINFAHAILASTPSSGTPSETAFFMRRLLKEEPTFAVLGTTKPSPPPVAFAVSGTTKPNPALKKICDKTDYPTLCISSITPFFKGKTDTVSVLQISIEAAIKQTKAAISFAQKLAKASHTPPETASTLQDCIGTYIDAVDNFHIAQEAILEKDTGTMNTMLSAAIADYETCNDEAGGSNPMAKYGDKLENMTDNCLVIASFMK